MYGNDNNNNNNNNNNNYNYSNKEKDLLFKALAQFMKQENDKNNAIPSQPYHNNNNNNNSNQNNEKENELNKKISLLNKKISQIDETIKSFEKTKTKSIKNKTEPNYNDDYNDDDNDDEEYKPKKQTPKSKQVIEFLKKNSTQQFTVKQIHQSLWARLNYDSWKKNYWKVWLYEKKFAQHKWGRFGYMYDGVNKKQNTEKKEKKKKKN